MRELRSIPCESYKDPPAFGAQAVQDYDHATDLEPNSEAYMRGLKKAKLELKKSKRKNYYKILGVGKV